MYSKSHDQVKKNERPADGTNETKGVEEIKIDKRNITNSRAQLNNHKVKREQKKYGIIWGKLTEEKYIFNF